MWPEPHATQEYNHRATYVNSDSAPGGNASRNSGNLLTHVELVV